MIHTKILGPWKSCKNFPTRQKIPESKITLEIRKPKENLGNESNFLGEKII